MPGVDRNNSHPFSSLTGSLEVKGVILQLPRFKLLLDRKNAKKYPSSKPLFSEFVCLNA